MPPRTQPRPLSPCSPDSTIMSPLSWLRLRLLSWNPVALRGRNTNLSPHPTLSPRRHPPAMKHALVPPAVVEAAEAVADRVSGRRPSLTLLPKHLLSSPHPQPHKRPSLPHFNPDQPQKRPSLYHPTPHRLKPRLCNPRLFNLLRFRPGPARAPWFSPSDSPAPARVRGSSGTTFIRSRAISCANFFSMMPRSSASRISSFPICAPCSRPASSPAAP